MRKKTSPLIDRGKVEVTSTDILETRISTCVSVCLFHPEFKLGGITHISGSRRDDTTPSGKYVKTNGYYYADNAIPRLLYLLKQWHPGIRNKSLEMVVAGGMNNEGPIWETVSELEKLEFKLVGRDVDKMLHRHVIFDVPSGIVTVDRKEPFAEVRRTKRFRFSSWPKCSVKKIRVQRLRGN